MIKTAWILVQLLIKCTKEKRKKKKPKTKRNKMRTNMQRSVVWIHMKVTFLYFKDINSFFHHFQPIIGYCHDFGSPIRNVQLWDQWFCSYHANILHYQLSMFPVRLNHENRGSTCTWFIIAKAYKEVILVVQQGSNTNRQRKFGKHFQV